MNILITGSKGFIGSHLTFNLYPMTDNIFMVDKLVGLKAQNISEHELTKYKIDTIVHLSANLFDNFEENLEATRHITSIAGNRKVIFASSAAVYGNNNNAKEDDQLDPFGEYGYTKYLEEQLVRLLPNHLILRLANVYGYGSDHGVFSRFISGYNKLNNGGRAIRDFVPVESVVGVIMLGLYDDDFTGTYNVGTGVGTTVLDLFRKLRGNDPIIYNEQEVVEIKESVLNIDKLRKRTGYKPVLL